MNLHKLSPENLQALDHATIAVQKITSKPYGEVRNSILSTFIAFQPQDPPSESNNDAFLKARKAITQSDTAGNRYTREEALELISHIIPRATKPTTYH